MTGRKNGDYMTTNKMIEMINTTEKGEKIYINAIGLTCKQIDFLRGLIQENELIPDTSGYKKPEEVATGKVILPQNEYIVNV